MIVLDCTLRDSGYYNNWEFSLTLANKYLKGIEKSKINGIEVGFRNPLKSDKTFGNVTDNFIRDNLYIPNVEYFGVMINTAGTSYKDIKKIFSYVDNSPINLVRAATHFKNIESAENICKELKNLGYTTTCNLMQAADKSYDEIRTGAKKLQKWGCIDVLYLADSLGGMNHDSVNYSFKAIKEGWDGLTGFHGHNNKSNALSNSLEAVDIGVDWIDATVNGAGRGPGNTEMEYLLYELNKRNYEFNINPIYILSLNEFQCLKDEFKWGPSLLYYLSAEYNIHPTYIQKMLISGYSMDKILESILYLKNKESNSFNNKLMKESLNVR